MSAGITTSMPSLSEPLELEEEDEELDEPLSDRFDWLLLLIPEAAAAPMIGSGVGLVLERSGLSSCCTNPISLLCELLYPVWGNGLDFINGCELDLTIFDFLFSLLWLLTFGDPLAFLWFSPAVTAVLVMVILLLVACFPLLFFLGFFAGGVGEGLLVTCDAGFIVGKRCVVAVVDVIVDEDSDNADVMILEPGLPPLVLLLLMVVLVVRGGAL